jgi:hypothetical protein
MWVDADDIWAPKIPSKFKKNIFELAFAIGYAENECVETTFPANNPIDGVPELTTTNPMTPLIKNSFWVSTMYPYCTGTTSNGAINLIKAVDKLFQTWKGLLKDHLELPISNQPYLLDGRGLSLGSGLIQIRAFAKESKNEVLLMQISKIQELLKSLKNEFCELVTRAEGLNYFGSTKKKATSVTESKKHQASA